MLVFAVDVLNPLLQVVVHHFARFCAVFCFDCAEQQRVVVDAVFVSAVLVDLLVTLRFLAEHLADAVFQQYVARGPADFLVEHHVAAHEIFDIVPAHRLFHLFEQQFQVADVFLCGAFGGEVACLRFDDAAELKHLPFVQIIVAAECGDAFAETGQIAGNHKGPPAVDAFQQSQGDKLLDCYPDACAADAQGAGQLVLRGHFFPDQPYAAGNVFFDIRNDLLRYAGFFNQHTHSS
jgi:hypothetical protein